MKIVLVNDIGHDDLCVLDIVPTYQESWILKQYGRDSRYKWTCSLPPYEERYPPLFNINNAKEKFDAWAKAAMAAERKR